MRRRLLHPRAVYVSEDALSKRKRALHACARGRLFRRGEIFPALTLGTPPLRKQPAKLLHLRESVESRSGGGNFRAQTFCRNPKMKLTISNQHDAANGEYMHKCCVEFPDDSDAATVLHEFCALMVCAGFAAESVVDAAQKVATALPLEAK